MRAGTLGAPPILMLPSLPTVSTEYAARTATLAMTAGDDDEERARLAYAAGEMARRACITMSDLDVLCPGIARDTLVWCVAVDGWYDTDAAYAPRVGGRAL